MKPSSTPTSSGAKTKKKSARAYGSTTAWKVASTSCSSSDGGANSESFSPMAPRKSPMTAMSGLKTFEVGGGAAGGGDASGEGLGCGSCAWAETADNTAMVRRIPNGRWTERIDTSSWARGNAARAASGKVMAQAGGERPDVRNGTGETKSSARTPGDLARGREGRRGGRDPGLDPGRMGVSGADLAVARGLDVVGQVRVPDGSDDEQRGVDRERDHREPARRQPPETRHGPSIAPGRQARSVTSSWSRPTPPRRSCPPVVLRCARAARPSRRASTGSAAGSRAACSRRRPACLPLDQLEGRGRRRARAREVEGPVVRGLDAQELPRDERAPFTSRCRPSIAPPRGVRSRPPPCDPVLLPGPGAFHPCQAARPPPRAPAPSASTAASRTAADADHHPSRHSILHVGRACGSMDASVAGAGGRCAWKNATRATRRRGAPSGARGA